MNRGKVSPTLNLFANERTGLTYSGGSFYVGASGIRVVCFDDDAHIHAFPDAAVLPAVSCTKCGKDIPGLS